ncbi:MAG: DUF2155 domain-containing protein [Deltaproteobacteria bacterium]|nr:DUF2155 domain-containing protein [Deltaproteobacteria bacterium]
MPLRRCALLFLVLMLGGAGCPNTKPVPIPPDERPRPTPTATREQLEQMRARLFEGVEVKTAESESASGPSGGTVFGANEDAAQRMPIPAIMAMSNKPLLVPDEVGQRYRAVNIVVRNKDTGQTRSHEVPLDEALPIEGTNLTIRVLGFLPALTVQPEGVGTNGTDPDNPAAKIEITEPGAEPKTGWLFQAAPGLLTLEHPTYAFALGGGVERR